MPAGKNQGDKDLSGRVETVEGLKVLKGPKVLTDSVSIEGVVCPDHKMYVKLLFVVLRIHTTRSLLFHEPHRVTITVELKGLPGLKANLKINRTIWYKNHLYVYLYINSHV